MRSAGIKIGEIGIDIENHLNYSRMVIAPEPKKGIKDIGMMGIGNTFVVTRQGGRYVNGHDPGLVHIELESGRILQLQSLTLRHYLVVRNFNYRRW